MIRLEAFTFSGPWWCCSIKNPNSNQSLTPFLYSPPMYKRCFQCLLFQTLWISAFSYLASDNLINYLVSPALKTTTRFLRYKLHTIKFTLIPFNSTVQWLFPTTFTELCSHYLEFFCHPCMRHLLVAYPLFRHHFPCGFGSNW